MRARLGRLVDRLIGLAEAAIDRVGDVDRLRCLEEARRDAERRAAEFAEEASEANDRLDQIGNALGAGGLCRIDIASEACARIARTKEVEERLAKVLREVGAALGVEGEPDETLFATAWEACGQMLLLKSQRRPPDGSPSPISQPLLTWDGSHDPACRCLACELPF